MAKRTELVAISAAEIRQKRINRGLSMEQAAIYCGVSRSTWRHYERAGVSNAIVVSLVRSVLG